MVFQSWLLQVLSDYGGISNCILSGFYRSMGNWYAIYYHVWVQRGYILETPWYTLDFNFLSVETMNVISFCKLLGAGPICEERSLNQFHLSLQEACVSTIYLRLNFRQFKSLRKKRWKILGSYFSLPLLYLDCLLKLLAQFGQIKWFIISQKPIYDCLKGNFYFFFSFTVL